MRVCRCPHLALLLFLLRGRLYLLLLILFLLQEVVLEPKSKSVHDDRRDNDDQDQF